MDMQSSSESSLPKPGDLVWAKMKGFPPWPARILKKDKNTPLSRTPVIFFGTGEKAFMKSSDLFDYYEHKAQYEVPRKHKGFNEGVHEIRVAAGLETAFEDDPLFAASTSNKFSSPTLLETAQDELRARSFSGKMLAEAFLSGIGRRRTYSASTRSRSRASSTGSALKKLHKAMYRRRLDSGSSAGSRHLKGLGIINHREFDIFDNFQCSDGTDFNMVDADDVNLLGSDDARSNRSKRSRASLKPYDDFSFNGLLTKTRNRSGSASGKRSRLVSGVSDVFDELLYNNELSFQHTAEELLHSLEEMPSESSEVKPDTIEATASPPNPEFVEGCGFEFRPHDEERRLRSHSDEVRRNDLISTKGLACRSSFTSQVKDEHKYLPETKTQRKNHSDQKEKCNNCPTKLNEEDDIPTSSSKSLFSYRRVSRTSPSRKRARRENVSLFSSALPVQKNSTSLCSSSAVINRNNRSTGRPRQYKVEKTPVMGANGQRQCTLCSGQVRPQMCGSNKHRWRCVDKKCRKWYGWVKSNEEIPRNVRKKGKWRRSIHTKKAITGVEKTEDDTGPASLSSQAEAALAAAEIQSVGSDCSSDPLTTILEQKNQRIRKKLGRPPKEHGFKIRLKGVKDKKEDATPKRKYVRRRGRKEVCDTNALNNNSEQIEPDLLPLTEDEKNYEPCEMEKRVRWWLSEKKRSDPSPERPFGAKVINSCAAFRILSQALTAAAVTRNDEARSVNGSLDMLMDSLLGSLGPLLTVASVAFDNMMPDDISEMLWNASAIHIPTFQ